MSMNGVPGEGGGRSVGELVRFELLSTVEGDACGGREGVAVGFLRGVWGY